MIRYANYIIIAILVGLLGLSVGNAQAEKDKLNIYMVVHGGINDVFWKIVHRGAQDAANLYDDVKLTYTGPATYNAEQFLSFVESAIAAKPDGLIVTLTLPEAMDEPLKRAIDRGLPVLEINARDPRPKGKDIPTLGFIGEDHYQIGVACADLILKKMGRKPKAAVWGNMHPGAINIQLTGDGFLDAMKDAGVPGEMLDVTTDPVKGTQVYIAYLKSHPDVEAIYSAANYFTESMVPAFIEADIIPGKDVFICSHDSTTLVNEYIKDGKVVGATEQQQYLQGFLGVNWMRLHLKHKFMPPILLPTGPAMITKENVEEIEALAKQGYR